MAWLAVNKNGAEIISPIKPKRDKLHWDCSDDTWVEGEPMIVDYDVELPKGAIRKLIGRDLTWEDAPVDLKFEFKRIQN